MLAWTTSPGSPGGLLLREVDEPAPLPDELVVRVEAFAPNPGDLAALTGVPTGSIPGWDGSGVVLQGAADGQGPSVGERVVFLGLAARGWAQRRAVSRVMTAAAPADVSWEQLATLPVPATSALRAVRRFGSLLGRRLLVVGATSAVGRFAVQLAARSGAVVIAVARDQSQHAELHRLGAHETHTDLNSVTPGVYGAIDMIGGQHLVQPMHCSTAEGQLSPSGTLREPMNTSRSEPLSRTPQRPIERSRASSSDRNPIWPTR